MYDAWCVMCDDWAVYQELFMYFDMFYIQWYHLARKDLRNKVHMNEWMNEWKEQTIT
jgi:hypothetical protein